MNYLTYDEIVIMINSFYPSEKAELIYSKLKDSMHLKKNKLFVRKEDGSFAPFRDKRLYIRATTCDLICASFVNLSEDDQNKIKEAYPRDYKKIFPLSAIGKYYPQLIAQFYEDSQV